MASLIIRNLDDSIKESLRVRAAQHGRSMEEEARAIFREVFPPPLAQDNLADLARELFGKKGIDLEAHPPVSIRPAPKLDT